jgi:mono/diheme cytochrome c family protein
MPANLVKGDDADAVATYVACVAGLQPAKAEAAGCGPPAGQGGGGASDPKSLFTSNCASCHTLAVAGATGTIGPNLDESDISQAAAIKQITEGGGGMPAFGDQLQRDQIDALATYIVENRGK